MQPIARHWGHTGRKTSSLFEKNSKQIGKTKLITSLFIHLFMNPSSKMLIIYLLQARHCITLQEEENAHGLRLNLNEFQYLQNKN
jgi:hypothetical protein